MKGRGGPLCHRGRTLGQAEGLRAGGHRALPSPTAQLHHRLRGARRLAAVTLVVIGGHHHQLMLLLLLVVSGRFGHHARRQTEIIWLVLRAVEGAEDGQAVVRVGAEEASGVALADDLVAE